MNIHILDARAEDAQAIREVSKTAWMCALPNSEHGVTKEDIEARFTFKNSDEEKHHTEQRQKVISDDQFQHYWIAKDGKKVVAFCLARKGEELNIVQALHVLPDYQGKGVGSELLEIALEWLGHGKDIQASVAVYNEKAIAFYEKFGFQKTGQALHSELTVLPSGTAIPQIEMIKTKS
jgi:ribosomal protein S18 acetylase RimI-like enzyme